MIFLDASLKPQASRPRAVISGLLFVIFILFLSAFSNGYAQEKLTSSKIFINKGTFTITLLMQDEIVAVYPIAIGRGVSGWPSTPEGSFVVENKSALSCWRKRCSPYGTRFMGLNPSHIGIHGTNQPHKIGTPASHGCVRMLNKDVELLFEKVPVGTPVKILTKGTMPLQVTHNDKTVTLKCLPLTPDTAGYCTVKPLIFLAGGNFLRGEEENARVIIPPGKSAVTFYMGESYAMDINGNPVSLTAPPIYHKGEFYAYVDDVFALFHLKSSIDVHTPDVTATATLFPYAPSMDREPSDRDDVPREPFTQFMTLH